MSITALVEDIEDAAPWVGRWLDPERIGVANQIRSRRNRTERLEWLTSKLGAGVFDIAEHLGLAFDPSEGTASVIERWLELRLGPPPRPQARPAALARAILQDALQAEVKAYEPAKQVLPEVERLVRWTVFYLLQGMPTDHLPGLFRLAAERQGDGTKWPKPERDRDRVLERLTLSQLGCVLEALEHWDRRPFSSERLPSDEPTQIERILPPLQREQYRRKREARNSTTHGGGNEELARIYLRELRTLLEAWTESGLIARGVLVKGPHADGGEVRASGVDGNGDEVTLLIASGALRDGDTVFLSPNPCTPNGYLADQARPLPGGRFWVDPPSTAPA